MEPVFPLDVDPRAGAGSLTQSLHGQLRAAILEGRLAAGTPLPSTRRAAEALGIARNTVVAAYDLLVAEGYVIPRRGAKAVVADVARRSPAQAARARKSRRRAEPVLNPYWRGAVVTSVLPRDLPARSFRLGVPEHHGFPHATWRRLSARALREFAREPFAYGPSQGLPALRAAIAQHVAFARAVVCTADDVVVTAGAQQAFDLIARLVVTPGETRVAVEHPGYPPLHAAFAAAGARLVRVPVDEEGLCVDALPHDVRVVSVTPSHQSPTGVALSLRRRRALLEFARRNGAVVIEDDYDGEFRFGGRPLDALQTLDADGRVFYVGTFSKSLFPALRKGFVVAPAWARDALAAVKHYADSHSDTITQGVLAAFIREGHLARHVRRMRSVYAGRREALLEALHGALSPWLAPIPSEAGLHLAARIRDPALAPVIVEKLRVHAPGALSIAEYSDAPDVAPAITFGYGLIDAQAIATSLAALARALRTR
jgi:GntR family transcriptional regulator/MocR family aminotransferase